MINFIIIRGFVSLEINYDSENIEKWCRELGLLNIFADFNYLIASGMVLQGRFEEFDVYVKKTLELAQELNLNQLKGKCYALQGTVI